MTNENFNIGDVVSLIPFGDVKGSTDGYYAYVRAMYDYAGKPGVITEIEDEVRGERFPFPKTYYCVEYEDGQCWMAKKGWLTHVTQFSDKNAELDKLFSEIGV